MTADSKGALTIGFLFTTAGFDRLAMVSIIKDAILARRSAGSAFQTRRSLRRSFLEAEQRMIYQTDEMLVVGSVPVSMQFLNLHHDWHSNWLIQLCQSTGLLQAQRISALARTPLEITERPGFEPGIRV